MVLIIEEGLDLVSLRVLSVFLRLLFINNVMCIVEGIRVVCGVDIIVVGLVVCMLGIRSFVFNFFVVLVVCGLNFVNNSLRLFWFNVGE